MQEIYFEVSTQKNAEKDKSLEMDNGKHSLVSLVMKPDPNNYF